MAKLVKTTVTIPEHMLQRAKIKAIEEKTSLSALIRQALENRLSLTQPKRKQLKKRDPLRFLGTFSIGIKVPYKHRSDLYDEHIKRKMGFRQ